MTDDAGVAQLSEDMQLFTGRVRDEAMLGSLLSAEVLARATMRGLGRQISSRHAEHLTGALPAELVRELTAHAGAEAESFDKASFIDQVAGELDTNTDAGDTHAGDTDAGDTDVVERQVYAVLRVLRSWGGDGSIEQTLAQLPKPLTDMFA